MKRVAKFIFSIFVISLVPTYTKAQEIPDVSFELDSTTMAIDTQLAETCAANDQDRAGEFQEFCELGKLAILAPCQAAVDLMALSPLKEQIHHYCSQRCNGRTLAISICKSVIRVATMNACKNAADIWESACAIAAEKLPQECEVELEDEESVDPEPSAEPTPEPSDEPTPEPTDEPTPEPSDEPTAEPTYEATYEATPEPIYEATPEPSYEPTPDETVEPFEDQYYDWDSDY